MKRIVIAVLVVAAVLPLRARAQKRDITIYDILNGTRVTGVELSPSGKYALLGFTSSDTTVTKRYSELRDLLTLSLFGPFSKKQPLAYL